MPGSAGGAGWRHPLRGPGKRSPSPPARLPASPANAACSPRAATAPSTTPALCAPPAPQGRPPGRGHRPGPIQALTGTRDAGIPPRHTGGIPDDAPETKGIREEHRGMQMPALSPEFRDAPQPASEACEMQSPVGHPALPYLPSGPFGQNARSAAWQGGAPGRTAIDRVRSTDQSSQPPLGRPASVSHSAVRSPVYGSSDHAPEFPLESPNSRTHFRTDSRSTSRAQFRTIQCVARAH